VSKLNDVILRIQITEANAMREVQQMQMVGNANWSAANGPNPWTGGISHDKSLKNFILVE
jgi:hypothetical protein